MQSFPKKNKPADFSGLVGQFAIEEDLSGSEIHVGDSVTLTVRLKGEGNVNRLPDIKMPPLAQLKTYADEPVFETRPGANGPIGSKTMKWALVPERAGEYTLPSFAINYFDPRKESYRVAKTKALVLNVLPGESQKLITAFQKENKKDSANHSKQAVKELGHDILPIYMSTSGLSNNGWLSSKSMGPENPYAWIVLAAPFLVYGAVFFGLRFNKKSDQAIYAQRARKAAQNFMKECRCDKTDANGIMIAVRDYINDRFSVIHRVTDARRCSDAPGGKRCGPPVRPRDFEMCWKTLKAAFIRVGKPPAAQRPRPSWKLSNRWKRSCGEISFAIAHFAFSDCFHDGAVCLWAGFPGREGHGRSSSFRPTSITGKETSGKQYRATISCSGWVMIPPSFNITWETPGSD